MKTNLLNKFFLTGLLTAIGLVGMAQTGYRFQADVKPIAKDGFYQLTLSPQIVAKCQSGLADIRIVDDKGQTVPYVMQKDLPVSYRHNFIEFPVTQGGVSDSLNQLIIGNPDLMTVKTLCLQIANNDVRRDIDIKGSNNYQTWYAVSENIELQNTGATNKNYYEQCIPIPAVNYRYLLIAVKGKNKALLHVLKAGIYSDDPLSGKYQELPSPHVIQKDTNNHSYIDLRFNDFYKIDKVTIGITSPKYFRRSVTFLQKANGIEEPVADPSAFSRSPADFLITAKTRELKVNIDNEDNPPLKLGDVKAYQLCQSLSSYLEAGKKYRVLFGDSSAKAPSYDLRFFTDSINRSLHLADLGPIIPNDSIKPLQKSAGFNLNYLMWAAIVVVLLALAFFTFKIANEVKAKGATEES